MPDRRPLAFVQDNLEPADSPIGREVGAASGGDQLDSTIAPAISTANSLGTFEGASATIPDAPQALELPTAAPEAIQHEPGPAAETSSEPAPDKPSNVTPPSNTLTVSPQADESTHADGAVMEALPETKDTSSTQAWSALQKLRQKERQTASS